MSSQTPPNPWFNTINYNPAFFSSASGGTVTLSYINGNFLRSTGASTTSSCLITNFTNGSINLNGVSGTLTIPANTGTAISVPNGNIQAKTLTTTGTLILSSATAATINTSTLAAFLNINTATGGTGYINFSPQNTLAFQVAVNGNTMLKTCDFQAGLTMSAGTANLNTSTLTCGAITTSGLLTLNSATAINRQITNSFYNFGGTLAGAPAYCGRIYGDIGTVIFDCPLASGISNFTFYAQNSGVQVAPFIINAISVIANVPITLPTTGVVPTMAQLGGTTLITLAGSSLLTTTYRTIATSSVLAVGTYLFNGLSFFNCTTAGTVTVMASSFSSTAGTLASVTTQLGTSLNVIAATQTCAISTPSSCLSNSCIVTVTVAAAYYLNCYWVGTGAAFTVGGTASFTRIA